MSTVRTIVTHVDEVWAEPGGPRVGPVRRAAAAAVVANPWAGRPVGCDLGEEAPELAARLAVELTGRLLERLGGAAAVAAFGKGAVVGLDGEVEHGAALIHTPYFGNLLREMTGGTSIIAFADDRSAAGSPLTVPLWHKTAAATRSHYQTVQIRVPDAPRPDEIVVVAAAAAGPRPHPRIGDRTTDADVTLEDVKQPV